MVDGENSAEIKAILWKIEQTILRVIISLLVICSDELELYLAPHVRHPTRKLPHGRPIA